MCIPSTDVTKSQYQKSFHKKCVITGWKQTLYLSQRNRDAIYTSQCCT